MKISVFHTELPRAQQARRAHMVQGSYSIWPLLTELFSNSHQCEITTDTSHYTCCNITTHTTPGNIIYSLLSLSLPFWTYLSCASYANQTKTTAVLETFVFLISCSLYGNIKYSFFLSFPAFLISFFNWLTNTHPQLFSLSPQLSSTCRCLISAFTWRPLTWCKILWQGTLRKLKTNLFYKCSVISKQLPPWKSQIERQM